MNEYLGYPKKHNPLEVYSLAQGLDLEPVDGKGDYPFTDKSTQENFYKKLFNPEVEHFMTLLGKGVFHMSDVIKQPVMPLAEKPEDQKYEYFSKEVFLEDVPSAKPQEMEAEMFLLHYIFSDWDHKKKPNVGAEVQGNIIVKQHHNLVESYNDKFIHYDYNMAFTCKTGSEPFRFQDISQDQTIRYVEKEIEEGIQALDIRNRKLETQRVFKQEFLERINEKLGPLENYLSDEVFFNAIIKKSGLKFDDDRFKYLSGSNNYEKAEHLRMFLMQRIATLREVVLLEQSI